MKQDPLTHPQDSIETIIKSTIDLRDEVLGLNTTADVRKMIYLHLISDANQFKSVRQSETTRALAAIMDQPHRPLNTIQKMIGIDTTPHA